MAKTEAQKRWNEYKNLQRQEVDRLRNVLREKGGTYSWFDYDEEEFPSDANEPIVLVNTDYYAGDVRIRKVCVNADGHIKIEADEKDGWAELTLDVDDIAFGHIDFIADNIPND